MLIVAPISLSPGALRDRDRLAGQHRLVDRAAAFDDDAVDRHLLAGPHAQRVADVHVRRAARPLRCRRASIRRAVFGARPSSDLIAAEVCERALQLEHLAEQRQRDDDRGGLEVDRRPGPSTTKDAGNTPGATVATTL